MVQHTMRFAANLLRILLQWITIALLLGLAAVVVSAVVARYVLGGSFIWYDEVASVLLAWITFYGAALAAVRRRHLGFGGMVVSLAMPWRAAAFLAAEAVTWVAFIIMAWAGWVILGVMGTETLVSVPWATLAFTQSVVPIGAALFLLAQLLSLSEAWERMVSGRTADDEEIAEEIARAQEVRARAGRTENGSGS